MARLCAWKRVRVIVRQQESLLAVLVVDSELLTLQCVHCCQCQLHGMHERITEDIRRSFARSAHAATTVRSTDARGGAHCADCSPCAQHRHPRHGPPSIVLGALPCSPGFLPSAVALDPPRVS